MIKYPCDCPEDCNQGDLPGTSFADCVDSVFSEESEISDIFISIEDPVGTTKYKPADWTSKGDWLSAIASSGAGIRRITVIGDMEEPESTTILMSGRRRKPGKKIFKLNASIDDLSIANYEFGRRLQCGSSIVIWYQTIGGNLYGGPNGFSVDVTKSGELLLSGADNFAVWKLQFQWEADCSPPRIVSPLDDAPIPVGLLFEEQFETQFE